jgi:hypothetical protein
MNKEYSKQPEEINKITGITPYLLIITMNVNGLFFWQYCGWDSGTCVC